MLVTLAPCQRDIRASAPRPYGACSVCRASLVDRDPAADRQVSCMMGPIVCAKSGRLGAYGPSYGRWHLRSCRCRVAVATASEVHSLKCQSCKRTTANQWLCCGLPRDLNGLCWASSGLVDSPHVSRRVRRTQLPATPRAGGGEGRMDCSSIFA